MRFLVLGLCLLAGVARGAGFHYAETAAGVRDIPVDGLEIGTTTALQSRFVLGELGVALFDPEHTNALGHVACATTVFGCATSSSSEVLTHPERPFTLFGDRTRSQSGEWLVDRICENALQPVVIGIATTFFSETLNAIDQKQAVGECIGIYPVVVYAAGNLGSINGDETTGQQFFYNEVAGTYHEEGDFSDMLGADRQAELERRHRYLRAGRVLIVAGHNADGTARASHSSGCNSSLGEESCVWAPFEVGGYEGTSFSVPLVAAAMMSAWAAYPSLTGRELIQLVKACADPVPGLTGARWGGTGYGRGRVDFSCLTEMGEGGSLQLRPENEIYALLTREPPAPPRFPEPAPGVRDIPLGELQIGSAAELQSRFVIGELRYSDRQPEHHIQVADVACRATVFGCATSSSSQVLTHPERPFTLFGGGRDYTGEWLADRICENALQPVVISLSFGFESDTLAVIDRRQADGECLGIDPIIMHAAGNSGLFWRDQTLGFQFFHNEEAGTWHEEEDFSDTLDDDRQAELARRHRLLRDGRVLVVAGHNEEGTGRHSISSGCQSPFGEESCVWAPFEVGEYEGTSFSLPVVAAAMMSAWAAYPSLTGRELIQLVKACADPISGLTGARWGGTGYGRGRVDFSCLTERAGDGSVHLRPADDIYALAGRSDPSTPDVNGDGEVNANDALVLYYSYALRPDLGNGR